jgi:hypothetical protein
MSEKNKRLQHCHGATLAAQHFPLPKPQLGVPASKPKSRTCNEVHLFMGYLI